MCAVPAALSLCCRYCIHSTFIKRCSGPSRSFCAWLLLVILFRPCTFAFRSLLTSRLGFRVFPPAASLIAAPSMIASRDQNGRLSVSRTPPDQRSFSEVWDYWGRGRIIFSVIFLLFLNASRPPSLQSHATSQCSARTQVLAFKRDEGGLRLANRAKTTDGSDATLSGGVWKRALKRLQGQWDVGTASVSRA